MTSRGDYAPAEWETLQFAPLWIHDAVGAGDGGLSPAETQRFTEDLNASWFPQGLIDEVFGSVLDDVENVMARYRADPRSVEQGLIEVADLLATRSTPDEAHGFKRAVLQVAAHVAEADGQVGPMEDLVHNMCATHLRHLPDGADPVTGPALRARFQPDEWALLELAPFWTLYAMSQADSTAQPEEGALVQIAVARAWQQHDPLLREVLFSAARHMAEVQARVNANPAADQGLSRVADTVEARVPEAAAGFKNALLQLALEMGRVDQQVQGTEGPTLLAISRALRAT